MPPVELRRIVGPVDDASFDNPSGERIWGELAIPPLASGDAYESVFDFGCGCGRNARQLFLQRQPPARYVGIDIHREMIQWCESNLKPPGIDVQFAFHDVWNVNYAPDNSRHRHLPIRPHGSDFTLINAHSVFTHLYEDQTRFYLSEFREMLGPTGLARTTWFFCNRDWFPMMASHQHTIFVSETDPTQAVYYDWEFFKTLVGEVGLRIVGVEWSRHPGFQSVVYLAWGEGFETLTAAAPPGTILGFGKSAPPNRRWREPWTSVISSLTRYFRPD